mmetsp:Transcript_154/g.196  ORF Transcript_154/g.196 Transcript_154/m.196 type:complete len:138 (+) Transcript_154:88-501(+)
MEFNYLGGTNPFRMVIDRENCASVGAPDYFYAIDKPMNLTNFQRKVDAMGYDSLGAFLQDVDLMLRNALIYNSHTSNPYRVAAEEMQKKYKKGAKRTVQVIKKDMDPRHHYFTEKHSYKKRSFTDPNFCRQLDPNRR